MTPTIEEFLALAVDHNLIPLREEIVVDRVTPVSVFERLHQGEPHTFLLESVEGGERFGRYSFVGQRPHAVFVCRGKEITYREGSKTKKWKTQNPLTDLKEIFARIRPAILPGLPRFWGGAVGYCGYDTARFFERLPQGKPDILGLPTLAFQISGEVVILDRFSQMAQVISNVYITDNKRSPKDLKQLYANGGL